MARSTGGGGGGGRSFGGRSMGGGSRNISRSFSGSGRTGIGGMGGHRTLSSNRPSGNHFSGGHNSGYRNDYGYRRGYRRNYGGGYYRGYRRGYSAPISGGFGCGGLLTALIILCVIGMIFVGVTSSRSSNKKLNRDKYNGSVDSQYGYYIDTSAENGYEPWIDSSNEASLNQGFKAFYEKTGVFPVLYIVETTGSTEPNKLIDSLYEELFKTEGNLLILFVSDREDYYFAAGHNIGEVIDDESLNVICDKINAEWGRSDDLAKIFGNGMKKAGKQIMAKSNFRVIMIALIIGLVVIVVVKILFHWWKARVAQKNKEQQDLENILATPLETFGSTSMQDLEAKYENGTPAQPQTPAQSAAPADNGADNGANNGSYWQNDGSSQNTYGGQDASFWANAANTDNPTGNQQ